MHGERFVRPATRLAMAAAVMSLLAGMTMLAPGSASAAEVSLAVLTGLDGSGQVVGLADEGGVAGNVTDENDNTTAFVWDGLNVFHVLPSGADSSEAAAFNGAGTLTGTAVVSGGEQAFVRTADGSITTAELSGYDTQAIDINENGTVVGVAIDAQDKTTPFTWTPPAAPALWPLAGEEFSPYLHPQFINDAGQISGQYIDQGNNSMFFWDPAESDQINFVEDLDGFPNADLIGMTEGGMLVMRATENGQSISYVWTASTSIQQLSSPGYPDPVAMGVGRDGTVVGAASEGALPFTWTASGGFSTLASCGSTADAVAVNADGQVVGGCQADPTTNLAPNVWRNGESAAIDVPSQYYEGGAGWVNSNGQVAGSFVDTEGTWYPFVASVTFETSPPEALAASASDGRVDLTWQEPSDDGNESPSTYNIYESGALVGTVTGDLRSFSHTGLANGNVYAYTVTAVNSAGESDPTEVVTAMPQSAFTTPAAQPVRAVPRVTG